MNKGFYSKLAAQNIRKNGKFYFPYFITVLVTVIMFYEVAALAYHPGLSKMRGAEQIRMLLTFGSYVVGIFAVIFLFYTNSFLIKRRKKEFGLYNILGMEKRHIAHVLFWESLIISTLGLIGGLAGGIVLNKLLAMILVKLMGEASPVPFQILKEAVCWTVLLFIAIFAVQFLTNIFRIRLANPIELLSSGHVGEREPKSKGILAVLGVATLVAGYVISWKSNNIEALFLFFVAVVLVIIGTYLLFTACSIVILKWMRKRKNFYYQTGHFTAVSGMMYRMKQNAVGLANICILSTMVMVIVSTTVSMNEGTEHAVRKYAPRDINIELYESDPIEDFDGKTIKISNSLISELKKDVQIKNIAQYQKIGTRVKEEKRGKYVLTAEYGKKNIYDLLILNESNYYRLTKEKLKLKENEAEVYVYKGKKFPKKIQMLDKKLDIKQRLGSSPLEQNGTSLENSSLLVVSDETYTDFCKNYNIESSILQFDIEKAKTQLEKIVERCDSYLEKNCEKKDIYYTVQTYQESYQQFHSITGGLLFLGVMLGVLFVMATVLIIYYKQISEGYEDKERFVIMQKVGMSKKEVRQTIRTQIRMVFYLPVFVAVVHVFAAFPIIAKILQMCMLDDTKLFFLCIGVTIFIFFIVYTAVYHLTARVYYKIIQS